MSKKNNSPTWTLEHPTPEFSAIRDAAASYLMSAGAESALDNSELLQKIEKTYPQADMKKTADILKKRGIYHNITDDFVDEVLASTHTDGYEITPWREAAMRVLIIDFFGDLNVPSAFLAEDCLQRVTREAGDSLRGTTKNACQIVSGQRTRLRKMVRMLVLAILYLRQFRPDMDMDRIQNCLMSLVLPSHDPDFIVSDFPFDDYLMADETLSQKGLFAICTAIEEASLIIPHLEALDARIQAASPHWRLNRIALVELNILRIGAYELFVKRLSSMRIIINESVELAKQFAEDKSKSFVNGILQQMVNDNSAKEA